MGYIMLKKELWPLVKAGKKRITIRRFLKVKPGDEVLLHAGGKIVGRARIVLVYRKKLGEIGEEEARKEGIPLRKLKKMLEDMYGRDPDTELTVAEFDLLEVFDPPRDPEEEYYGSMTPQEIARMALEKKIVESEEERKILEELAEGKSIREIAFQMGGLHRRRIIRRIVRKYRKKLEGITPS